MPANVRLEDTEWQQVVAILREVAMPWRVTNPLIVKLLTQLQEQQQAAAPPTEAVDEVIVPDQRPNNSGRPRGRNMPAA